MIVFVHGVPETSALWDGVRRAIGRESVALSLPGFGCPRPDGFGATMDDYARWLGDQLAPLGPVDLVGHDWGAGLTYRVVTTHGDLVRSWVADVANVGHPDYVWHDFARIWQTPGEGEAFFEAQAAISPEERAGIFESMGVPHDGALTLARGLDDTMAGCILDLYRSATPNIYRHWGDAYAPTAARGLVLHPTEDPFGEPVGAAEVASMLGADIEVLEGAGHWWPLEDPEGAAAVLLRFWGDPA